MPVHGGKILARALTTHAPIVPTAPRLQILHAFTTLHGLVSLLNNRVLPEVTSDSEVFVDLTIRNLLAMLIASP